MLLYFRIEKIIRIVHTPADYSGGKEGDVITVEFSVFGVQCILLNEGPYYKHSEVFLFQIATESQEEPDQYWIQLYRMVDLKACMAGVKIAGVLVCRFLLEF